MDTFYHEQLNAFTAAGNLRTLPHVRHEGIYLWKGEQRLVNLSSNDYLGLSADLPLRKNFLERLTPEDFLPTAASSRLLTGNFEAHERLEKLLRDLYGSESALVFNSGYHANSGILPALADEHSLILADKLVHASLIDGIRLSAAKAIRYRHNDYDQLERLVDQYQSHYRHIFVATESIFSMDGDCCNLKRLVELKKRYPNIVLYLDEAHAVGVRGRRGLGYAEECNLLPEIDLLIGTFGKALASVGAYLIARGDICRYLINTMRPLIFSTALPPINLEWSRFILEQIPSMENRRELLQEQARCLREAITGNDSEKDSNQSHIIPWIAGTSLCATQLALQVQRLGYYVLPVRPPTVPAETARLRFSLSAGIPLEMIRKFATDLKELKNETNIHSTK